MSSSVCTHCGSSDIDIDPARGDAVCTNCGSVLEDQIIISEVQFAENAIGGTSVIGQYVSSEGNKSHSLGTGFHHGFGKESRAITLQNGKRKIESLGAQLKLNQHCIDTAYNFFKMAVHKHLTRGRKTSNVIAACLYLVCRTEGTPHMLLDFSDLLQTNVYVLGRTYLQLSRELCINVPAIDPCLYIHRFAHKLEFGEKTHEVSMTALRLVQRMKRDWLHAGRRPSGLCGAALLVASRIHDFNRTTKDVIKIVKVCEATLRKRLTEFEDTPSSQLTIDEFQRIDLEEEQDPPSFIQGKRKARLEKLEINDTGKDLTGEISNLQAEIEKALDTNGAPGRKKKKKLDEDIVDSCGLSSQEDSQLGISKDIISNVTSETPSGSNSNDVCSEKPEVLNDACNSNNLEKKVIDEESEEEIVDKLQEEELDDIVEHPPWESEITDSVLGPRPTAASLGLKESIQECMTVNYDNGDVQDNGELNLDGINDEELDKLYMLSEPEIQLKTTIWMRENADYLKEQEAKKEREAKLIESGQGKPEKKKREPKKKSTTQASTAGEAIEKMLQEKKISNKINYDVLKDLNRISGQKKEPVTPVRVDNVEEIITPKPSALAQRFKRPSLPLGDTKAGEFMAPPAKKQHTEQAHDVVVVESGPIEYAKEHDDDIEDEEAYYNDEDDVQNFSAAQLMGNNVTGDDDYEDDYY